MPPMSAIRSKRQYTLLLWLYYAAYKNTRTYASFPGKFFYTISLSITLKTSK